VRVGKIQCRGMCIRMYMVGANGNIPEGTDEDNTRCAVAIQQDCELRKVSQILQFEHGAEFSGGACHGTVFIKSLDLDVTCAVEKLEYRQLSGGTSLFIQ